MRYYCTALILGCCIMQGTPTPAVISPCPLVDSMGMYLKERTIITCTCEDTDPGIVNVFWESLNFGLIGQTNQASPTSDILSMEITRLHNSDTFSCRSSDNTTTLPGVSFAVRVAYGPDNVYLDIDPDSGHLDVCPTCNNNMRVTCLPEIYFPNPNTTIYSNGTAVANSDIYMTQIATGGQLYIACESKNVYFPEIVAANSTIILVREPPITSPLMTVDGLIQNSTLSAVEGMKLIMCRVVGGFPVVDNVTVQCGSLESISVQGNDATLHLDLTRDLNGASCSCWASHETGLYNIRTDVLLDVWYRPFITNFTVNEQISELYVSNGTTANFTCLAEGNPKPTMNMSTSSGTRVLWTGVSPLLFQKELTCNDTANYTCVVSNAVGQSSARTISVNVLCVPVHPQDPPLALTEIIVGVVVPVVVIAIVITVVAVIIYRRRSRLKGRAAREQINHISHVYDNVVPSPANVPGNSNGLPRPEEVVLDKPAFFHTHNSRFHGDRNQTGVHDIARFAEIISTRNPLNYNQSQKNSDEPCIEIIPVTYSRDEETQRPGTDETEPPEIPEKSRLGQTNLQQTDRNPYSIPRLQDHITKPEVDITQAPPIPTKQNSGYENMKMNPVSKKKDS